MNYLHLSKAADFGDSAERRLYRMLEILPGLLAWSTLAVLIALSFIRPVWIAIFIIAFDIYWLFRTLYLLLFLRNTYKKMKQRLAIDWILKLNQLPPNEYSIPIKNWQDIVHLVFLPMYKENLEVVRSTFNSLKGIDYPKNRLIVVLATEERGGQAAQAVAMTIKREFGNEFGKLFFITLHPGGIAGELAGKGSNLAWAASQVKKYIKEQKIPAERIIVSAFDIDTQVPVGYFSCLTYTYLTTPKPTQAAYQPIPFYNNNIWQAPALARVLSYSSTFWHMMQQERPDLETTFSSHSMSWQMLCNVNFWQRNMVSEDSRIFFQGFFRYNGDYRVVSLYYPVSMDANVAPSFWRTMQNQYKQQRRWAWGVENIPYFLFNAVKNKKVPLLKKLKLGTAMLEGFWSWATNSLIIFMLGWLPILVGGPEFRTSLLSYSLPRLTGLIMTVSMFGIITSAVLSILLMPPPTDGRGRLRHFWIFLQWIFSPIVFLIFGSIPALDAQTRLMLGKYMGFWVTEKARIEKLQTAPQPIIGSNPQKS